MWKKFNNWLDRPITWRTSFRMSGWIMLLYIIGWIIGWVYYKQDQIREFGKRVYQAGRKIIHKDSKEDDIFED